MGDKKNLVTNKNRALKYPTPNRSRRQPKVTWQRPTNLSTTSEFNLPAYYISRWLSLASSRLSCDGVAIDATRPLCLRRSSYDALDCTLHASASSSLWSGVLLSPVAAVDSYEAENADLPDYSAQPHTSTLVPDGI